jgi:hypothetical protein
MATLPEGWKRTCAIVHQRYFRTFCTIRSHHGNAAADYSFVANPRFALGAPGLLRFARNDEERAGGNLTPSLRGALATTQSSLVFFASDSS